MWYLPAADLESTPAGNFVPQPSEGVGLVDHHHPDVREPPVVGDAGGDQHRLERLRCGEQDVGRLREHSLALRLPDVAVPEADAAAHHRTVAVEPLVEVVQQRPQGADV